MQATLAAQMELFNAAHFSGIEVAAMIRAADTRELQRQAAAVPPIAED